KGDGALIADCAFNGQRLFVEAIGFRDISLFVAHRREVPQRSCLGILFTKFAAGSNSVGVGVRGGAEPALAKHHVRELVERLCELPIVPKISADFDGSTERRLLPLETPRLPRQAAKLDQRPGDAATIAGLLEQPPRPFIRDLR